MRTHSEVIGWLSEHTHSLWASLLWVIKRGKVNVQIGVVQVFLRVSVQRVCSVFVGVFAQCHWQCLHHTAHSLPPGDQVILETREALCNSLQPVRGHIPPVSVEWHSDSPSGCTNPRSHTAHAHSCFFRVTASEDEIELVDWQGRICASVTE